MYFGVRRDSKTEERSVGRPPARRNPAIDEPKLSTREVSADC